MAHRYALLAAIVLAAAGADVRAAAGKLPSSDLFAPPLPAEATAPQIDPRRPQGAAAVVALEEALSQGLDAVMSGKACDAVLPLADAALAQDPQRLAPRFVHMRCAMLLDGVDRGAQARADFVTALANVERLPGEFHPDRVVAVKSLVEMAVYLRARNEQVVADQFAIEGGGQRLYYVATVMKPDSNPRDTKAQSTVRFDLGDLVRALVVTPSPESRGADTLIGQLPAAQVARALTRNGDLRAQALTGLAVFAWSWPGASLTDEAPRAALERAVEADAGNACAAFWLAYALLANTPPIEQMARATTLARVAANRLADGDVLLAAMAEKGIGTKRSSRERDAALSRAGARIGMPRAQALLAQLLARPGTALHDDALALDWLRTAARAGDAMAQWQYGKRCAEAKREDKDCAVEWFERAAKQGSTIALRLIARQSLVGDGVPVDLAKAHDGYQHALAAGDANAAGTLGLMMFRGDGTAQDRANALELFRRGAAWGDPSAQASLAALLYDGDDVAADPIEALRWYRLAARQGEKRGYTGWARMLEEGAGTAKNEAQARELYETAANLGDRFAMRRLAVMLREGRGGDADEAKANALEQRAEEK